MQAIEAFLQRIEEFHGLDVYVDVEDGFGGKVLTFSFNKWNKENFVYIGMKAFFTASFLDLKSYFKDEVRKK